MQSNIDLTTKNKKLHNQHSDHIESPRQYFWFLFLSQQESCFSLSTARITDKLSCDLHICMCRCVGVCKCKWIHLWSPEEGDGTPLYRRAGVTDSCESHYVGVGNWTKFSGRQVQLKRMQPSLPDIAEFLNKTDLIHSSMRSVNIVYTIFIL